MPEHPPHLADRTMPNRANLRWGLLLFPMLTTGCIYHAREAADESVRTIAARPYDLLPDNLRNKPGTPTDGQKSSSETPKAPVFPDFATDVQTSAYMIAQGDKQPQPKFQLQVPDAIPGSEVPLLTLPADPAARAAALRQLYLPLPPLAEEIRPLPGPEGRPYTLADLQRIAAENSPTLLQAAAAVQAARGNMVQAATYPNPSISVQTQPSNNNSTGGSFGFAYDQVVVTGGKIRLQTASAKKDLENAELALKRARSDLATQVRSAYYALLVAKETMRVTRALSVLTDEVYRVQLALSEKGGIAAAYEPAALRAQAYSARLAYQQSRATYIYSWAQLVAAIGVRQLPLSEVSGRIDTAVPYYEYEKILAQVLSTHTDVLTARNGIVKNKYNLKLNQITPYFPNLDVVAGMYKDRVLNPIGTYHVFQVTAPLPIWDHNKGNIMAAEAALATAIEEPHRVELALTTSLANAYSGYRTNLDAVEYYRRYVLPDQILAYRGVLQRRQVDLTAQFADLVTAQQTLSTSVTTYLGLLGSLWTSVVSVADLLQTDDLFQTAQPVFLPALPSLENLPPLPGCHPYAQKGIGFAQGSAQMPTPTPAPMPLPAPTPTPAPMPLPTPPPVPAPTLMTEPGAVGPVLPQPRPVSMVAPGLIFMFFCNPGALQEPINAPENPPTNLPPIPSPPIGTRYLSPGMGGMPPAPPATPGFTAAPSGVYPSIGR